MSHLGSFDTLYVLYSSRIYCRRGAQRATSARAHLSALLVSLLLHTQRGHSGCNALPACNVLRYSVLCASSCTHETHAETALGEASAIRQVGMLPARAQRGARRRNQGGLHAVGGHRRHLRRGHGAHRTTCGRARRRRAGEQQASCRTCSSGAARDMCPTDGPMARGARGDSIPGNSLGRGPRCTQARCFSLGFLSWLQRTPPKRRKLVA